MLADFMTVIPQTHSMVLLTHRPEFRGALTPGSRRADTGACPVEQLGIGRRWPPSCWGPIRRSRAGVDDHRARRGQPVLRRGDRARPRRTRRASMAGAAHTSVTPDVADISVPATLQATIAARIDRLDPPAKRTLCAAAVIGMRFDADLLASMGVDPVARGAAAGRADRSGEVHRACRIRLPSSADSDGRLRISAESRSRRTASATGRCH